VHTIIDGLLINYKVLGDENAFPLVILHGWSGSLALWEASAQRFSKKHKVILVDLPGFGSSVRPKDTWDIYDYARFVKHFLAKLSVDEYLLLGHSFGGRLGIILGATSQKVKKLVLVDAAGLEKLPKVYKAFLTITKPIVNLLPSKLTAKIRKALGSSGYNNSGSMKDIFVKVVNEDLFYLLKDVKTKTLVVWGSNDKVLDVQMTKLFKENVPDCLVRIVWGAGHSPHSEKEERFVEIVGEFLDA
jgi:pimeloyl-ACP methyl ester carboxylesterase